MTANCFRSILDFIGIEHFYGIRMVFEHFARLVLRRILTKLHKLIFTDVAKILAFSKMVEQELGKKIEHENDTPEKEQSQEHGQDQERQANARGWSDYPATPEQIDLTATVLAADEGVSIDEIKKDFSENPSIGELQIALEAKGQDFCNIGSAEQEEIIKSTDQRNHEHSRAHDSQDHGDAHGSENKAR